MASGAPSNWDILKSSLGEAESGTRRGPSAVHGVPAAGGPSAEPCLHLGCSLESVSRAGRAEVFPGGLCRTEVGSRHRGAQWTFLRVYVCCFSTGGKAIAHSLLLPGSVRLSGCCRPGTGQGRALRVAAPPPKRALPLDLRRKMAWPRRYPTRCPLLRTALQTFFRGLVRGSRLATPSELLDLPR